MPSSTSPGGDGGKKTLGIELIENKTLKLEGPSCTSTGVDGEKKTLEIDLDNKTLQIQF